VFEVGANDMQVELRSGKGIADANFVVSQMQKKHGDKGKNALMNLEKASDRVRR